jgi:hypothetical protein
MNRVCSNVVAAIAGGVAVVAWLACAHRSSRRQGVDMARGPQSLNRWEGEGGAVPGVDDTQTDVNTGGPLGNLPG